MAFASRRCLTTLTHHGASLLSNLQRLKPPTASRSLCHSSLIERDWADPTQLIPPHDLKMEREKVTMGYRFGDCKEQRHQSYFRPSVLFFVGKQPYEALRGDIIYTERLNCVDVKEKVYFVKVALLSLHKHRLIIREKNRHTLRKAYVEAVIEDHDLTKLRVLDFGLCGKLGFKLY